jgi:hypothetical protein
VNGGRRVIVARRHPSWEDPVGRGVGVENKSTDVTDAIDNFWGCAGFASEVHW